MKVIVQPGERVRAGESIIAAYAYVPERTPVAEAAVEVSAHRSHTQRFKMPEALKLIAPWCCF